MGLRILADQCVPASVIKSLSADGHQVLRLRDFASPDAPDSAVIAKAQELDALLLSLDADFADIVSYRPGEYRGIIALQVRNHPETLPLLVKRLNAFLSDHEDLRYYAGKLLIVEAHRIRIRD